MDVHDPPSTANVMMNIGRLPQKYPADDHSDPKCPTPPGT